MTNKFLPKDSLTIQISLPKEVVIDLDEIAKRELSSRNRILRLAIRNFIENYKLKKVKKK